MRNTISPNQHYQDGEVRTLSSLFRQREDITGTSSQVSSDQEPETQHPLNERSIIAESPPQSKKTTSKGKRKSQKKNTRTTKSSKTSGQDSISKGKDSLKWWTESSKNLSEKLLSRIEIGSVGLPSTSSNGSVIDPIANSWFKTKSSNLQIKNSQKISWPSYTSSLANSTGKDVIRSRKIRLKVTQEQAKILRKWMRAYDKTWNMALKLVKDNKREFSWDLKKDVVTKRTTDTGSLKELKKIPAVIRKGAVKDLCDANEAADKLYKAKMKIDKRNWRKTPFEIKYKSRKRTSGSFPLEKDCIHLTADGISLFSRPRLRMDLGLSRRSKNELKCVEHDCRISYIHNRWYINIPENLKPEVRISHDEPNVLGVDPGIRTAFSCFGTDGKTFDFGVGATSKADQINAKIVGIQNKMKNLPGKKYKLRKALHRHQARAKDFRDELHWKTISYMTDHYDVIVMGKLNVKSLMMGHNRTNKKHLSFLSHYMFRERLLTKGIAKGNLVLIQEEHGTTQGCPVCGFKKLDVGSSKVYTCDRCTFTGDRDTKSALCMILSNCS